MPSTRIGCKRLVFEPANGPIPFRDDGSIAREQVAECLRFFGVATVPLWKEQYGDPSAAFRSSDQFAEHAGSVAAWLRQGKRRGNIRLFAKLM